MTSHGTRNSRSSAMVAEIDWTRKYKRALLERNPVLQISLIHDACQLMKARSKQLPEYSLERRTIERARHILSTIRQAIGGHD